MDTDSLRDAYEHLSDLVAHLPDGCVAAPSACPEWDVRAHHHLGEVQEQRAAGTFGPARQGCLCDTGRRTIVRTTTQESRAMAVKTDRMEARVSPEERERIERAASASGLSVSAFLVSAAVERAEEVIAATTTTTVPADYFDDLLTALDVAEAAPRLAKAAKAARRRRRIAAH